MNKIEEIRAKHGVIIDESTDLLAYIDFLLNSIERISTQIEQVKADRDEAIQTICNMCQSADKKAGIVPTCVTCCPWQGKTHVSVKERESK